MKMLLNKKLLTISMIIAAGAVSFGLAGCSNNDDKESTSSAETQATETTLSGEEIDALFNIGKAEGNIYKNDFFNIRFEGGENWRLLNDEQLATISSSIKDVMTDEEAKKALEDGKTSIIMYAVSKDAKQNASITVEKHNVNNTHEADLEAFLDKSVTSLMNSLPGQGFTDLEVEKTDLTFCGEPAKGITIKGKYSVKANDGSDKTEIRDIYETMVYTFRGSYSGCVTASSFDVDKTAEVLKMFSKAE